MTKMEKVQEIIATERWIKNRIAKIEKLKILCVQRAMGSGGVGQVKYYSRLNETRIQIGYGSGSHNYAQVAIMRGRC